MTNETAIWTHPAVRRSGCVPHGRFFVSTVGELGGGCGCTGETRRTDRLDATWAETLDRIRAFVASRVGDPELAADITQDVVARSVASGALERVDNPTAWLYRSARNAVIDHYRTRHVARRDRRARPLARPRPDPTPNRTRRPATWLAACSRSSTSCHPRRVTP